MYVLEKVILCIDEFFGGYSKIVKVDFTRQELRVIVKKYIKFLNDMFD